MNCIYVPNVVKILMLLKVEIEVDITNIKTYWVIPIQFILRLDQVESPSCDSLNDLYFSMCIVLH